MRIPNRLLDGSMTMNNVSGTAYQVATAFNDAGGILSKTSTVNTASSTLSGNASAMGYDLAYNYNQAKPHQLEAVVDQVSGNTQQFVYNESGSIKQIQDNTQNQEFYWNEEQWLNAVRNDQGIHHYVYDDKGERIMKSSVIKTNVYVNDQIVSTIQDLQPYTLYVNPYFVITEFSNADKVSKHYYMGTQRVASELAVQTTVYSPMVGGTGSSSGAASTAESFKTLNIQSNTIDQGLESQVPVSSNDPWLDNLNAALTEFGEATLTQSDVGKELPTIESIYPDLSLQSSYKTTSVARVIYWYHPDYIGNVDLVTDMSGEAYEFFLYNPWGENLYEWNSGTSTWTSPYRFNGKELDQETGFHYYGARYHELKLSVWLSVDPMAMHEQQTGLSPYLFSNCNPIMLLDPDGNLVGDPVRNPRIAPTNAGVKGGFFGFTRTYSNGKPKFHGGVDIQVNSGTPLKPIASGVVVEVVNRVGPGERGTRGQETGNYVIIKSKIKGETVYFKYAHLDRIDVKEEQEIDEKTTFGLSGTTGNASGLPENRQHVHIEASTTSQFYPGKGNGGTELDTRIDPLQFFETEIDENGQPILKTLTQPQNNSDKHSVEKL